jgi:hypothetical protein
MLATPAGSPALPFPSVSFLLNFLDDFRFAVARFFTRLFQTDHGGRFQAVAFTPPAAGSNDASWLFRQLVFDYRLRFGVDQSGRIPAIGRRTRRG